MNLRNLARENGKSRISHLDAIAMVLNLLTTVILDTATHTGHNEHRHHNNHSTHRTTNEN